MALKQDRVTIVRQAGKTFPPDVLDKLIAQYPSSFGATLIENGKMDVLAASSVASKDLLLEMLNTTGKNVDIMLSFGKSDGELSDDDLQPMVILEHDEEGTPVADLVLALSGEFAGADIPETTHTEHFFAASKVREEVVMVHTEMEGDLEKTIKAIDGPRFRKFAQNLMLGAATLSFMASNGKQVTIKTTDKDQTTSWGWSSVNLANPPGVHAVPEKKVEAPPMSAMDKLRAKMAAGKAGTAVVEPAEKEEKPNADKPVLKLPDNKGSVPAISDRNLAIAGEPKGMKNGRFYPENVLALKAQKGWYGVNRTTGRKNAEGKEDWASNPGIAPEELRPSSPLYDRLRSFSDLPRAAAGEANEEAPGDAGDHGDTAPHHIEAPGKAPGSGEPAKQPGAVVSQEDLPIIQPNMRTSIKTDFLANRITTFNQDPKALELEQKLPSHQEQTGYKLEDALTWTFITRKEYCRRYPQAAALLMGNIIHELFKQMPSLLKALTTTEPVVEESLMDKLRKKAAG